MTINPPAALYASDDLLAGYEPDTPLGFTKSWDFEVFRQFVADGGAAPKSLAIRNDQALHDAAMAEALKVYLDIDKPRLVGVMGGHAVKRGHAAYAAVARLARYLARNGFVVVTGGGPGAMEAGHVGAAFAGDDDAAFDDALTRLAEVPDLPRLSEIITPSGNIAAGREKDLAGAQRWMNAAIEVRKLASAPKPSIAIPTWLYGHEPTIPFASVYAKYFQNSIREEALVTESRAGIIYARGGGGTVREIFQDAESNYYVKEAKAFTPMIFFDPDGYWQRNALRDASGDVVTAGLNLEDVMRHLFEAAHGARAGAFLPKLVFSTNFTQIRSILEAHVGVAQANMMAMIEGRASETLATTFAFDRLDRVL